MHAIAVELARPHVGQVTVPDQIGLLTQRHTVAFGSRDAVEQTQFDARGMGGKEGEVHSSPIPGGSQRIGATGPDSHRIPVYDEGTLMRKCYRKKIFHCDARGAVIAARFTTVLQAR